MKVIIQIPCYNEEKTLPITLRNLPSQITGIDEVEVLVIDDGSQDASVKKAIENNVDYVISHTHNLGLAEAFKTGLEACLHFGADIIVNTDADNQYNSEDICKLIEPIIQGQADYIIGARPIAKIKYFSLIKKILQIIGSRIVKMLSGTNIMDTTSGFRAISRKAALRLNVFNDYTYTVETIIQSGRLKISTLSVPIRVNENLRPSKLISNTFNYLKKSFVIILRSFLAYHPLKFFILPGLISILFAVIISIRYLFFYFSGMGAGHIQSLLLSIILFTFGTSMIMVGLLSDLISVNRKLLEDVNFRTKLIEQNVFEHDQKYVFSQGRLVYSKRHLSK